MIWLVVTLLLNFFINLFIVYRNDEYCELIGWKIKTKNGYQFNKEHFGKPYWAAFLPCMLTPLVFNFFIKTNKEEEVKNSKKRELAKKYREKNPHKR